MKLIYIYKVITILSILKIILNRTKTKLDFSVYHTTEQIEKIMNDLKSTCYPSLIETSADVMFPSENKKKYSNLKAYDITMNNNKANTNNKLRNNKGEKVNVFILAGEHPRELISVEFILNFVKYLCMGERNEKYLNLVNSFNFRIIINANPISRQLVEKGEYCRRTNLNYVDINRNWNIFWSNEAGSSEEFPGQSPFSEVETNFINHLVEKFNPKLFLTIHSGAYGLFMPYAYLKKEGELNKENMKRVLNQIKNKFCPVCDVGAPSLLIGYESRGTCLDYVYDNYKIPYSLAWEIYTNEKSFKILDDYVKENSTKVGDVMTESFLTMEEEEKYELVSTFTVNDLSFKTTKAMERTYSEDEKEYCIKLFNPTSKEAYEFTIINWTKSLIYLLKYVKEN